MAIRTVVVGVDLGESGARALRLARDTAHATKATLWLVHAAEEGKVPLALERERLACEAAGLSAQTSCERGAAWETILRTAVAVEADLIAVGDSAKSSAVGERALGSTAERVLQDAPCSVLVSCGRLRDDYQGARIVVGIDFSAHSVEAARWARDVARAIEGQINLVHVDANESSASLLSGIVSRLEQLVLTEGLPTGTEVHALPGPVGSTLCQYVDRVGADLLFVGRRGLERLRGRTLGSVSQYCLRNAQVPVLAVRP
jgi:nucleotide-binding universal stress UspA family protein